jgi:hypothetical protein
LITLGTQPLNLLLDGKLEAKPRVILEALSEPLILLTDDAVLGDDFG